MTQPRGNDHPKIVAAINQAIGLASVGQLSLAAQLLTDLLAEFPQVPSVHGYLAWFLLDIGRTGEAVEHSRQAINLAPKSEKASLIHFHVLWKVGKQIDALDEMKRFLMIGSSEEYSRLIKEWDPLEHEGTCWSSAGQDK